MKRAGLFDIRNIIGLLLLVYGVILLLVLFLLPNGAAGLGARIASLTKRVL